MTPLELETRRKRLGLSQEELGRCISMVSPMPDGSSRPPVRQSTIAGWEGARGIPDRADRSLPGILDAIKEAMGTMRDRVEERIKHSIAVRGTPMVAVRGCTTDAEFWHDWPDFEGWSHTLWNIAATVAMDERREEHGIISELR